MGAKIGHIVTEATKIKIRQSKLGSIPWNKGIKGWTVAAHAGFQKGHTIHLGKKWSLESRKKLQESTLKRTDIHVFRKGNLVWNKNMKGIHLSPSSEFKRGDNMGTANHSWKGGISSLYKYARECFEYKQWRKAVFERDGYTCVDCGDSRGGNLNADHITPFAILLKENNIISKEQVHSCKTLWNIDNGRTLCSDCHKKTPTWGQGTRNILNTYAT